MVNKKVKKKTKNPWIEHLVKYHKAHPERTYSENMVEATKTYKGK